MTRKTFGEKMKEEQEKYESMSKEEKKDYLEKKFPGLEQRLNLAIQIINEIRPLIPEIPQIEVKASIDPATKIGIEQIDLMKKQTEKADKSLILSVIAIIISGIMVILTLLSWFQ